MTDLPVKLREHSYEIVLHDLGELRINSDHKRRIELSDLFGDDLCS